jgi:hypothetical protein
MTHTLAQHPFVRSLVPLIAFLLGGCAYEDVELKDVTYVGVDRFDGGRLTFTVHAVIENPNGYRIQVSDPDIDLYLNGAYMGKAEMNERITLLPETTATYVIPLHVARDEKSGGLLGGLLGVVLTGKAELRMSGTVRGGRNRIISKRFPFEERYEVDLRQRR